MMKRRGWMLGALAAGASVAVTAGLAMPARAALPGSDWTLAKVPDGVAQGLLYGAGNTSMSCVHGTRFCLVIGSDENVTTEFGSIGQAAMVTTDAGQDWTDYTTLPTDLWGVAASCATMNVCFVTGWAGPDEVPAVAETTDGGKTWASRTSASLTALAGTQWSAGGIDCVSTTTCWIAGSTGDDFAPSILRTTDGGATWKVFGNLPSLPAALDTGYMLDAVSCVSAISCVATGGQYQGPGPAVALSTVNGGTTWKLSYGGALGTSQAIDSVTCMRAFLSTTCYGSGVAYPGSDGVAEPVVLVSADGGVTWRQAGGFPGGGWFSSISCASLRNCWAASSGSSYALVGTSDGGAHWSTVTTTDPTYADGAVGCLSLSTCVAIADNAFQVTTDDGGLRAR